MDDIVDRLRSMVPLGRAFTVIEKADAIVTAGEAADEIERLRVALHAAISRPAGVVPDVALEFYDPKHPALGPMAQV